MEIQRNALEINSTSALRNFHKEACKVYSRFFNDDNHLLTTAISVRDSNYGTKTSLKRFPFLHLASKTGLLVPELLPPPAHRPKNHVITWKPSLVKYSSRSTRGLWKLQVMKHLIPITAIL